MAFKYLAHFKTEKPATSNRADFWEIFVKTKKGCETNRKLEANFWLQFLKPVLGFKGASSVMESEIFLPPK